MAPMAHHTVPFNNSVRVLSTGGVVGGEAMLSGGEA